MFDRDQAISDYSDMYKELHGVRPRGVDTSSWTEEKFEEVFRELAESLKICAEEDARAEQQAIAEFEDKVTELLSIGCRDRRTAVIWLAGSVNETDPNAVCWQFGLPYNYLDKDFV